MLGGGGRGGVRKSECLRGSCSRAERIACRSLEHSEGLTLGGGGAGGAGSPEVTSSNHSLPLTYGSLSVLCASGGYGSQSASAYLASGVKWVNARDDLRGGFIMGFPSRDR